MDKKIIYYTDPLNDEFAGENLQAKKIGVEYKYIRSGFFASIHHFFWYHVIFRPFSFIYLKLKFHHRIEGKEKLKPYKKEAYYMYGNHTLQYGDPYIYQFMSHKEKYVITNATNVSLPVIGKLTPYLGALPLPDDMHAYKNFLEALEYHENKKHVLVIYPEAHIWPFYTHIRPFKDDSFAYPLKHGIKTFCFTNTFQKRGKKGYRVVTYIDGPFECEGNDLKSKRKDLRDKVYCAMVERSKLSNIELIQYVKKEEKDD